MTGQPVKPKTNKQVDVTAVMPAKPGRSGPGHAGQIRTYVSTIRTTDGTGRTGKTDGAVDDKSKQQKNQTKTTNSKGCDERTDGPAERERANKSDGNRRQRDNQNETTKPKDEESQTGVIEERSGQAGEANWTSRSGGTQHEDQNKSTNSRDHSKAEKQRSAETNLQSTDRHRGKNIMGSKLLVNIKSATGWGFISKGRSSEVKWEPFQIKSLSQPSSSYVGEGRVKQTAKATLRRVPNLSKKQPYIALSFCSQNITSDQGCIISVCKQTRHLSCSPLSYIPAIYPPSLYPIKTSSSPLLISSQRPSKVNTLITFFPTNH